MLSRASKGPCLAKRQEIKTMIAAVASLKGKYLEAAAKEDTIAINSVFGRLVAVPSRHHVGL